MSGKSIMFSILATILYVGVIVGAVFLFKVHFLLGIAGVLLLFVPLKLQRKAISEASGKFDDIFAKYIVAVFLLVALIFVVLYFTLWMK